MITSRNFFYSLLLLPTLSFAAQTQQPETTEQAAALERLDAYTKYAGAGSVVAAGLGYALKNDALTGLGVGTFGGIATGVMQKNFNWLLVWLAESLTRNALVRKLAWTNPADMDITTELEQTEKVFQMLASFDAGASEEEKQRLVATRMDAVSRDDMKKAKAMQKIQYSAQASSWLSYLVFRYLEKQTEKQA